MFANIGMIVAGILVFLFCLFLMAQDIKENGTLSFMQEFSLSGSMPILVGLFGILLIGWGIGA